MGRDSLLCHLVLGRKNLCYTNIWSPYCALVCFVSRQAPNVENHYFNEPYLSHSLTLTPTGTLIYVLLLQYQIIHFKVAEAHYEIFGND